MYNDNHRGHIGNENRFKQSLLFEGMERMRKITPTDIDGFIDYNGNSFIYFECKLIGVPLIGGQRKALENIINSHNKSGNFAIAIHFKHNTPPEKDIIVKDQFVKEYYFNGRWIDVVRENITVLESVIKWEEYCKKKNIKL